MSDYFSLFQACEKTVMKGNSSVKTVVSFKKKIVISSFHSCLGAVVIWKGHGILWAHRAEYLSSLCWHFRPQTTWRWHGKLASKTRSQASEQQPFKLPVNPVVTGSFNPLTVHRSIHWSLISMRMMISVKIILLKEWNRTTRVSGSFGLTWILFPIWAADLVLYVPKLGAEGPVPLQSWCGIMRQPGNTGPTSQLSSLWKVRAAQLILLVKKVRALC